MHQSAQIQPPHQTAQVQLALARRDGRTHGVGEFLERPTPVQSGSFVEEGNGSRIPLVRDQTAGVEGGLTATFVFIGGSKGDDEDEDFGGEMDWMGMHLGALEKCHRMLAYVYKGRDV